MQKHEQTDQNNLSTLTQDARALVAATVDVAGDKVAAARKRLTDALGSGKETLGRVREGAVEQAKAADEMIRNNPYHAVLISFGIGALIGYLAARSCQRGACE